MRRRPELSAVILAGGRSSRMGRAKASLPLDGVPLLARVVARVRPLVSGLIIVAAPDQELPPVAAGDVPMVIVRDPVPYAGPLRALALGLDAMSTSAAIAVGCDAPFVSTRLLDLLAGDLGDDAAAVIPTWDDRPQPLVAAYKRTLLPAIEALLRAGETRLQALARLDNVRLIDPARVRAADPEGASFTMLNTPDEFAQAARLLEPAAMITHSTFSPYVGQRFLMRADAASIPLVLIEVRIARVAGAKPAEAGTREPFSLIFRGPAESGERQRTYRLEHETAGAFDLFLVPIGPDAEGMRYEAVFS